MLTLCRHGQVAPCPRCEASRRASAVLGVHPIAGTAQPPLATCEHLGKPCPTPPGGDPRRSFFLCEAGRGVGGIVCRCHCGPTCPDYSPEGPF